MIDDNRLLGVVDVARALGVGKLAVMRMMDLYATSGGREGLPWLIVPGAKCRKVRAAALDDYLRACERIACNG